MADATWLALNVVSGGGSFSSSQPIGVTKIAKSVIAPLADQNISVFMLSTYQTDFILVTASLCPRALGNMDTPADVVCKVLWPPFSDQIKERSGVPQGHQSSVSMAQPGLWVSIPPHPSPAFYVRPGGQEVRAGEPMWVRYPHSWTPCSRLPTPSLG